MGERRPTQLTEHGEGAGWAATLDTAQWVKALYPRLTVNRPEGVREVRRSLPLTTLAQGEISSRVPSLCHGRRRADQRQCRC